ncbi:cytochrome protein [Penicillium herquei]|nr:cytochrome protein [Penicillium herquei]
MLYPYYIGVHFVLQDYSAALITCVVVAATALVLLGTFDRILFRPPLPPGPRTLPFIGHLHLLRHNNLDELLHKWHQVYGPIVRVQLGTQLVISIGTHAVARDLLDRRGSIYSSRPQMVMAGELATKGVHTATLPYGLQWRTHNRVQQSIMSPRASRHYRPLLEYESTRLLHELQQHNAMPQSEEFFSDCFKRYVASILLTLNDGEGVDSTADPVVCETLAISEAFIKIFATGTSLIDLLPILKHLPRVFSPWKRAGDAFYQRTITLFRSKAERALRNSDKGVWNWTKHIESFPGAKAMSQDERRYALGILYEAGVDTVVQALRTCLLAAALFPEATSQAQRQLDEAMGNTSKMPHFEDLSRMPYVRAFIQETLRWWVISPVGLPHALTEDDEYMGYHIPRATMVLACYQAINTDETTFPDGASFRPERWLDDPTLPVTAFGFGRRACVGRHLAWDMLCIAVARILWLFNVDQDPEVPVAKPFADVRLGAMREPASFRVRFRPRTPRHLDSLARASESPVEMERMMRSATKYFQGFATRDSEDN